jgi:hypothetical protein
LPFPAPPDSINANFAEMNARELRRAQEEIWEWLSEAEAAPFDKAPDDDSIQDARDALNEIIEERRNLHSDEPAPRGG